MFLFHIPSKSNEFCHAMCKLNYLRVNLVYAKETVGGYEKNVCRLGIFNNFVIGSSHYRNCSDTMEFVLFVVMI